MAGLITFPPNPDAVCDQSPEVWQAKFGDGYEQLMPKRLTPTRRKWSASYDGLSYVEYQNLFNLIDAAYGVSPVSWQSPLDDSPRQYLLSSWRVTCYGGNVYRVDVELEEL